MPPRNDNPRRKNGFSTPYNSAQLSTWVALPALIVEFLVVVAPVLPLEAAIPCTIIFCVTAALAAYYAFLVQKIDPLDDHLAKHLGRQQNGNDQPQTAANGFGGALGNVGEEVEPLKYCWICETQVAEHAMHCKYCNKCVGNFDHHCLWLNTCVGKNNYHYFLLTMVYITAMLIVHSAVQIGLIIDIFLGGASKERADGWFGSGEPIVVAGICIGFVAFDAVALSLILQLLYFHMLLRKEGLTTYKYILRETQKKRERANQEEARKDQRMVAMGKANDEGKTFLALQLRFGEICQYCDPLPPLEEKKEDDAENPEQEQQQSSSNQVPAYKPVSADEEDDGDGLKTNDTNGNSSGFGENGEVKFVNVANGNGDSS